MIITTRSTAARYSTDIVAQNVRDFIAPSTRLESHPPAAPNGSSNLDLAFYYPRIFGAAPRTAQAVRSARTAFGTISLMRTDRSPGGDPSSSCLFLDDRKHAGCS
jgi:hypothetical protein